MKCFRGSRTPIGRVMALATLGIWACSASPESPPDDTLDVHTAGQYYDGSKFIPCYWTGTTRTDLTGDGTRDAGAYGIFVD